MTHLVRWFTELQDGDFPLFFLCLPEGKVPSLKSWDAQRWACSSQERRRSCRLRHWAMMGGEKASSFYFENVMKWKCQIKISIMESQRGTEVFSIFSARDPIDQPMATWQPVMADDQDLNPGTQILVPQMTAGGCPFFPQTKYGKSMGWFSKIETGLSPMLFDGKIDGFRCRFCPTNQSIE